ncbi:unnamed protein product [Arabis nemorensis]|uniref:Uncharacterized protein n=1 Tax=Arabis nemorensis TaxID=586526 RepID=A0A565BBZ2_9BRAS|nr:unnamed protein product [Arabis nemorensis]
MDPLVKCGGSLILCNGGVRWRRRRRSTEVAWIVKKGVETLRFLADNRSEPQGHVIDTEILFLERTKEIQI